MKRLLILCMLALTLAACKNERVPEPGVYKFHVVNNLPVIPVIINGKGGMLLIDSGATSSFIDIRLNKYYGFGVLLDDTMVDGIGGTRESGQAYDLQIVYNDSIIKHRFKTANLGRLFENTGTVGILGSDYLRKNDMILNYEDKTLKSAK